MNQPALTLEQLRETIEQRVLYRDGMMLVLNKPPGVPVHRGPAAAGQRNAPDLESAFDALRFGLPRVPSLAHRLDRDTSGCLVLGRHRKALEKLGRMFRDGAIDKTYLAVVRGRPPAGRGEISLPLARRDPARGWWMKVDPDGLPSVTLWRALGEAGSEDGGPLTLMELTPVTGRTHQLRVHCAAMGWPIVGDAIYGDAPRFGGPGLHLHARSVTIPLYPAKPAVHVVAPPPPHMATLLARCGFAQAPGDAT
ncbi:RluA family pseudouridine synthase [Camelimonas abortus]|uniref:RluA family pseudouridine synthase n=1 Tax=Camelimonas abortus TaxID=1017184 RepID=A0ABV7LD53_9HYPH